MSTAMDRLMAAVNKAKSGTTGFQDPNADKMWKLEGDKARNGYAIIRFLPGATDEKDPFVKLYTHGFKSPTGKWFIENCPTTIGGDCPVCAANGVLWNSGNDKDKEVVRQRKRKLSYISNVLVVSDTANPDNEGKVFMFKYGQKIFDKVVGALTPEFKDETPFNPFDPETGANFKLKMRQVDGYANFDKSEFDTNAPIGKDKQIKEVLAQLHDLETFTAKDQFKSYDDLEKKRMTVLGNTGGVAKAAPLDDAEEDEAFVSKSVEKRLAASKPSKAETKAATADEDDDLSFFKSLAEE